MRTMGFLELLSAIKWRICALNSNLYINCLRKKGVSIGDGTRFFGGQIGIDASRPCLVEIGRNCVLTEGVVILVHGYEWAVLREKYGEMYPSSGKVVLEDNVFVGARSIILKGVRIGKNTIIGAGSVVAHDIPPDSVAAGNPCKVIMSIDEFREKRKKEYLQEAKAYAFEIYRKTGKVPTKESFWDEFPLFLRRDEDWGKLPVKEHLGSAFVNFMKSKPVYNSLEEFLIDAGIPKEKINEKRHRNGRKIK
jgi:acetyltransferase-like isoleucine patch superfamily enzyme